MHTTTENSHAEKNNKNIYLYIYISKLKTWNQTLKALQFEESTTPSPFLSQSFCRSPARTLWRFSGGFGTRIFPPSFFGTSKFRMSGRSWFILISNPFPCLRKSNWQLRLSCCVFFTFCFGVVHSKLGKWILSNHLHNERVHNDHVTTKNFKETLGIPKQRTCQSRVHVPVTLV